MSRSRITIRDVAARAGVSHQTVSRVINNNERVRPETRAAVEAAIAELDYRPNAMARSMARGRSGVLACISPNLTDYTFASIIDGAEREARKQGYFLLSASAPDEKTFAAMLDDFVSSRRAEGVIVINPHADERHKFLPKNYPLVFAGARPHIEVASSVALDDEAVARTATQHLIDLGHQQIGCLTGPMAEECSQDRYAGYTAVLAAAGLPYDDTLVIEGDWSAQSGYDALMSLAKDSHLPTAFFVQGDQMAVGALRAARDLGLQLPDQLSIIGIDDIPLAAYFSPPLTTLKQDFMTIGRKATGLLIETIKQPEAPHQHLRLPAEFVLRRSTSRRSD